MGARRVAPATIVAGKSEVRRAEVGGGYKDGRAARVAPSRVIVALDLEASAATQAIVEERCAQCCCVHSISLAVQIPVPTSTTCTEDY